jgi:hypothetical protein
VNCAPTTGLSDDKLPGGCALKLLTIEKLAGRISDNPTGTDVKEYAGEIRRLSKELSDRYQQQQQGEANYG